MSEREKNIIPPIEREEWKTLVKGQIPHQFQNFVLQMKVHKLSSDVKLNKVSIDQAVNEIYSLCDKYSLAVSNDLKTIFKTW